ncbi:MAG TPA: hypothetical protein VMI54_20140 [Polyangiaceae bacterium]|nr:hypothetical protein [Polyangiaceae bacterium]
MVTYAFEKLYADLVTSDGTVCIVYVAWTELFGVRRQSAGIELYTPEGRREVVHAREPVRVPELDAPEWCLRLELPSGPFEFRHRGQTGGWSPEGGRAAVSWCVKSASGRAEARFSETSGRAPLVGQGYADWVVLRQPTRKLGFERVEWGRAHVGKETLVWNRIRGERGDDWTRVLSLGAERREARELSLAEHDRGVTVVAHGAPPLELDRGRVLHAGPALDRERIPSSLARGVATLVSPKMTETRWVRRARRGDAEGWALHERVYFGGAA